MMIIKGSDQDGVWIQLIGAVEVHGLSRMLDLRVSLYQCRARAAFGTLRHISLPFSQNWMIQTSNCNICNQRKIRRRRVGSGRRKNLERRLATPTSLFFSLQQGIGIFSFGSFRCRFFYLILFMTRNPPAPCF